jgi:hypothetical protein
MKKYSILLLVFALVFSTVKSNASTIVSAGNQLLLENKIEFSIPKDKIETIEQFLKLTPKQIEKMTGKKLSLKQVITLKIAQKKLKNEISKPAEGQKFSKGVWILLAILGWCWLLMGISDGWTGGKWITNLILYVLCWLPGLIHSLVHMNEYTE